MRILTKKTTYPAPKWFIKIFNDKEKDYNKLLSFLEQKTGYNKSWCEKNQNQAINMLKPQDEKTVVQIMGKSIIAGRYAWNRYNYTNWEKVKEFISNPLVVSIYDIKNKKIIIKENSQIIGQIKNIRDTMLKQIRKK